MPDFAQISSRDWIFAIILGVMCTALAYLIHFRLINNIEPTQAATVTFLIPIFSFVWGYLLLNEQVTLRMIGATVIILFGMSLVTGILKLNKS